MATPIVLLHGFTGTPRSWDAVLPHLPPSSPTWAPALPGHVGGPEVREGFSENLQSLVAGVRQRGWETCYLVGYSLGARCALGLLCEHPHLVAGATLIGVHPGLSTPEERAQRAQADRRWVELLTRQGVEAFVRAWEALPLWETQDHLEATALAAQRRERLRHTPRGLAQSLEHMGLGQMPDYAPALSAVKAPVHLVTGALDEKFTSLARGLLARSPHLRHRVVPGVGHNVVLEAPKSVWIDTQ